MIQHLYKLKKISLSLFLILLSTCIVYLVGFHVTASELSNIPPDEDIKLELEKAYDRFENSMLDIPERFQEEIILYKWVADAIEQYLAESGIESTYYCDLRREMLYNRKFIIFGGDTHSEGREYSVKIEDGMKFTQDSYQLKLESTELTIYIDINIAEKKVHLYPATRFITILPYVVYGNPEAYELIERDEDNQTAYYPDFYVVSDWDDMEVEDNYFAGVDFNELQNLDYLKIPEDMHFYQAIYMDVAVILKRYMEEQGIEDVFYFDADKDIVCGVTNMIFTCRVRGKEHALYIDIDGVNMKCHVYEVED